MCAACVCWWGANVKLQKGRRTVDIVAHTRVRAIVIPRQDFRWLVQVSSSSSSRAASSQQHECLIHGVAYFTRAPT